MKKLLFIFCLCLVSLVANAQMPYNYSTFFSTTPVQAINTDGTHLEANLTSPVLSWNVGAVSIAANPTIQDNTLSYSDGNSVAYVDNTAGKQIVLNSGSTNSRNSVFYLSSSYYSSGTTFYLSALINVSAAGAVGQIINFNNSSNGGSAYGRVYIKSSGTGYVFSTGAGGNNSGYSSTTYAFNTTHLIVLKYVITSVTNSSWPKQLFCIF